MYHLKARALNIWRDERVRSRGVSKTVPSKSISNEHLFDNVMLFSSLNQDSHAIVRSWHIFFIAINCKDEVSYPNSQHFQLNAQLSLPDIISKN